MSRIVELKDQSPLILKKAEMEAAVVAVCRCGLSAKWPYCDGSHSRTLDEEAGKQYAYTRNEAMELRKRELAEKVEGADPRPFGNP